MNILLRHTPTKIWLFLVAATLMSWELGTGVDQALVSSVLVAIAAIKIRLVYLYFMELRTAPFFWRALFDLWLGTVAGAMIIMLLLPKSVF